MSNDHVRALTRARFIDFADGFSFNLALEASRDDFDDRFILGGGAYRVSEISNMLRFAAQLAERGPIGAAIMRERAAEVCKIIDHTQGEPETQFDMGYDQACIENAEIILKLPLPTHAETLAYALQLPEIKELVNAGAMAWQGLVCEYGHYKARVNFGELDDALEAIAALEPKP
jgi:hypothetical protein